MPQRKIHLSVSKLPNRKRFKRLYRLFSLLLSHSSPSNGLPRLFLCPFTPPVVTFQQRLAQFSLELGSACLPSGRPRWPMNVLQCQLRLLDAQMSPVPAALSRRSDMAPPFGAGTERPHCSSQSSLAGWAENARVEPAIHSPKS